MKPRTLFAIAALTLTTLALPAGAATFHASFWDIAPERVGDRTDQTTVFPEILDVIAMQSPDLTFRATTLDYPNSTPQFAIDRLQVVEDAMAPFTETATLADFLGVDAAGLSQADKDRKVAGSIFRFRGAIDVNAGQNIFDISSDDGFQLSLDGVVQPGSATAPRGLATTQLSFSSATARTVSFDLIYYDIGVVGAGLAVQQNGAVVAPAPVPLPAAAWFLAAGLLSLGLLRRSCKT